MAMASKGRLTSKNDIELRVVVKFCSGHKLSPVETLEQIQNAPANRAYATDIEINLICFSHNVCRIIRIEPPPPPPPLGTSFVPQSDEGA